MNERKITIGAKITREEVDCVKRMMAADMEFSQANFIRRLIRQEYERRHPAEKGQKKECEEVK